MYVGTYTGWADIGEVDGVQFPKGVPVEIDRAMRARLKELPDYEVEQISQEAAAEAEVVPAEEAKVEDPAKPADNEREVNDGDGSV